VLTGDFSCRNICWDSLTLEPGNPIAIVCKKLIEISVVSGLTQIQQKLIKLDSVLDLLFTSNPSLISSIDNIPGISTADEHEAIIVDTLIESPYDQVTAL
jgi:hypothetical protein